MSRPKQHRMEASPAEMDAALHEVYKELDCAQAWFPTWPNDLLHGVAVMAEESGEAVRACLQHVYDGKPLAAYRKELVQTAAMAVRCIIDLDRRRPDEL